MTTATPSRADRRPPQGFTLTELIVAAAISGFLLVAVLSSFLFIGRSSQNLAAYSDLEASGRGALERFARDVREAGTVTWHHAHSLTLGSATGAPPVTYTYDPARQGFYRLEGTAPGPISERTPILVRNVSALTFTGYAIGTQPVSEFADLGTEEGRALAGRITKHLQISLTAERGELTAPSASMTLSTRTTLRNKRLAQ